MPPPPPARPSLRQWFRVADAIMQDRPELTHSTFPAPQSEDGTYTGFIKVHLKLRRPVTVPAGIRPQSIYDAIKEVDLAATTDKRTSFYLPLDAIKQLHISSTTTVSEVIQGLLKKFMVVDNPQKFALFKRIHKDGQGMQGRAPGQKPSPPLKAWQTWCGGGLGFPGAPLSSHAAESWPGSSCLLPAPLTLYVTTGKPHPGLPLPCLWKGRETAHRS